MTLFAFLSLILSSVLLIYSIEFIIRKKRMNFRVHLVRSLRESWLLHLVPAVTILLFASLYGTVSAWEAAILFSLSYLTFTIRDFVRICVLTIHSSKKVNYADN